MYFIDAIRDVMDGNIPSGEEVPFLLLAASRNWWEFALLLALGLVLFGIATGA